MKRILGITLAFFFLGAAPALATTCPANLQLKDNAGVTAPGKYSDDGSGNCRPNAVPGAVISTGTGWTSATTLNATQTLMGTGQGSPALLVQLDQTSTITGGVVTFEGTYDNTNWVTIPTAQVLNSNTFASLTNPYTLVASTNQPFLILTQGYQSVRVRLSTVITGTATVTPQITLLPYNPTSATAANQTATQPRNVAQWGGTAVTNIPTAVGTLGSGNTPTINSYMVGCVNTVCNNNGAAAPSASSPVTPSNQPVGGGTIVTNQVSVGTTVGGTQIIAARTGVAGTGRISATVCNTSTTDVCVVADAPTTATGQLLVGVKGACITLNTTAAIFGIVGAGTETVSFSETF